MAQISIIVPVYNVETYLRECLDSLLVQTFSDIEFICINDGSTDNSLEILKEYASKDVRVKIFDKLNEGYGKTMNLGILKSESPYIGIVESDDFVKSEMFETLYAAIKEFDADVVKCNFYKYKVSEGFDIEYSKEYPEGIYNKLIAPIDFPEIYHAHSSVWGGLYSKEFLEKNQIDFNETPGASYQDIAFNFKVLSNTQRMVIIQDALLYYRTDNLMSSVHSPYKIYCICDEVHTIEEFIKKQSYERQVKLWPILMRRKFYDYLWNYHRLSEVFQFAFFEKMAEEFKNDYQNGKFENIEWKSINDKNILREILETPFSFFMKTVKKYSDERRNLFKTLNGELKRYGLFKLLQEHSHIIIYGAGKIGQYVADRLNIHGIKKDRLIFAVTDLSIVSIENTQIPVRQIDELISEKNNGLVLVAVKGDKQLDMINNLIRLDYKNVLIVDEEILRYLREERL